MKRSLFDPKAMAKELRARRKQAAADAKKREADILRARNLRILMGIKEEDRPFWPECSVSLRVGAIRPMRRIDSVAGKPGLQGDVVASASSYNLDIPSSAGVALTFDPRAHVEFLVGTPTRILGYRKVPAGSWTFIVTLTDKQMGRLRDFAASIDAGASPWTSTEATVLVRAGTLTPLLIEGIETPDFIGLVDFLQFGTAAPDDS